MGVYVTTIEIMSCMSNYNPQKTMTYDYLSIPLPQLNHVSKGGPGEILAFTTASCTGLSIVKSNEITYFYWQKYFFKPHLKNSHYSDVEKEI